MLPSPFHSRTVSVCESHEWRNWSGYLAAGLYEPSHDREYYAIRNSAALIDVSPLYKYEVSGPDALRLVDRLLPRDVSRCRVGQVLYSPWCDEEGRVIDDGTIARLDDHYFRITAADPSLRWFQDVGYGLNATVRNVSAELAAVALQGPLSRAILQQVTRGIDLAKLPYFHLAQGTFDGGAPLTVTRTGYTGDLGYELWVRPEFAERLWDCLVEVGGRYGLLPAGIIALDIARVEAGLVMIDVDYKSAHKALIEAQKSSPYEIGLGWTVNLNAGDFIGRRALRREKETGSPWTFVGVEIPWLNLERLFGVVGLPPQVPRRASRSAVPVYKGGRQIGQITSHTFSPILKKYIGIGNILTPYAAPGAPVEIEITVEYSRQRAPARVVRTPFFDPPRKRS